MRDGKAGDAPPFSPSGQPSARPIREKWKTFQLDASGGDGGIRTLDRPLQAYNGLANRRLQPLGHVSNAPGMPDTAAGCKRQNWDEHVSLHMKALAVMKEGRAGLADVPGRRAVVTPA